MSYFIGIIILTAVLYSVYSFGKKRGQIEQGNVDQQEYARTVNGVQSGSDEPAYTQQDIDRQYEEQNKYNKQTSDFDHYLMQVQMLLYSTISLGLLTGSISTKQLVKYIGFKDEKIAKRYLDSLSKDNVVELSNRDNYKIKIKTLSEIPSLQKLYGTFGFKDGKDNTIGQLDVAIRDFQDHEIEFDKDFIRVAKLIMNEQSITIGLIANRFKVGYSHRQRILDKLEEKNIIKRQPYAQEGYQQKYDVLVKDISDLKSKLES